MRHDSLRYKTSFYASNCIPNEKDKTIQLGYIFVDMIRTDTLTVVSGTNDQYTICIPKEMQNIPLSHQFNYQVEIV